MVTMDAELRQLGDCGVLVIPQRALDRYGWTSGLTVTAQLVEAGPRFRRTLVELAGMDETGIILPRAALSDHSLQFGDVVGVPFGAWARVEEPPEQAQAT